MPGALAPSAPPATAPRPLERAAPLPAQATFGDLNVNGTTVIAPPSGHMTYYQAGNITVFPSGHLLIRNTTLTFVQFVGDSGTVADRLQHLYTFTDLGNVTLLNSTITTDLYLLNPFPILNLRIDNGSFRMTNSSLEFPGNVNVTGPNATFWAFQSKLLPNPNVKFLAPTNATAGTNATLALYNASRFSPSLWVEDGARMTLLQTLVNASYRNQPNATNPLGLRPDTAPPVLGKSWFLNATTLENVTGFATAANTTSALALQAVFPTVSAAWLSLSYNATNMTVHSVNSTFNFRGSWLLPQVNYTNTSTNVTVPLPPGAIAAINSAGVLDYLASLSDNVSVTLGPTNVTSSNFTFVNVTSANLSYEQPAGYNITVWGNRTNFTGADSVFDLNWSLPPGTVGPLNNSSYAPWNSTKLVVGGGAEAFLANIAVPYALPTDYQHQSIAIPMDNHSSVTFYRWLTVPVESLGGLPVPGATVWADYAYNGAQTNNATATERNNLSLADPDLARYVASWDATNNISSYGMTNYTTGNATLLLASDALSQAGLPDGQYLGDYHIGVYPGGPSDGPNEWEYASLTAYPYLLYSNGTNAPPPDAAAPVVFPEYNAVVSVTGPTISVGPTLNANHTVAIGETLYINATVRNSGNGIVTSFNTFLRYDQASQLPLQIGQVQLFPSLSPGQSRSISYNWTVDPAYVGIHPSVAAAFLLVVSWTPGSRSVNATDNVTVLPSYISLTLHGLPVGTVQPGSDYAVSGRIGFTGNGSAYLNITVLSDTGGFIAGNFLEKFGNVTFNFLVPSDSTPGNYTVSVSVAFADRTVWHNYTDQFAIDAPPPPAPSGPWYQQSFVGLALWLWIIIVVIIAAALAGFLLFARQAAKGKLVECGECGALIPEDAPTCPKCHAEFETESVRCSRCGATITATSKFCPECAVTLLGRGLEERDDPERQGYADFVERFRVEARKELAENYAEGSFWDWWRRQSSYTSFTQWRLQQSQGSRVGMTAPRETPSVPPPEEPKKPRSPPKPPAGGAPPPAAARPPPEASNAPAAPPPSAAAAPVSPDAMKVCGSCQKEIPAVYLVCPFCGAVTQ
jgi:RNA polymerase subunit RPABC4/transcription elongation factor Spt4